ncbi:hypothetical protein T484DRAFT_1788565 [Baffinella frigidus]|nr:hypothetical protein T484DRAFT_1788565 [Cryptophyta sp. CCMP2293]
MATATVKHVGYTLLLDHAKDQLGFMSQVPAANEFSGDVPNEVSPHAQNNEFTYSFSSGSDIVNHTISLTTGIWSLASLTAEIDAGLSAEGHAGAFRVSTDTDGYVAFEVRLEGYQARFSNTVSVGRYLGLPQRDFPYLGLPQRDFPCRPGTDVACSGAEAGDAQGLSTASKRYQTRSTNKRPLAPTFAASGTPYTLNPKGTCTGTCYCAETPGDSTPLCLEAGSGIAAPTGNARDASGCSCAARGEALLQRNATVQWGRLLTFTAPLPDGVYTLASLNTAIEQGLAANKHSTSAFYFLQEPGGEARLQLTVLPASFQVTFHY